MADDSAFSERILAPQEVIESIEKGSWHTDPNVDVKTVPYLPSEYCEKYVPYINPKSGYRIKLYYKYSPLYEGSKDDEVLELYMSILELFSVQFI